MPTLKTIPSLSGRKLARAVTSLPLAAVLCSLFAVPLHVSAAPTSGGADAVPELAQRLARLEALVQKQQATIESQAARISSLQNQLQNAVLRDSAGNVAIPGNLAVGRSACVARHLLVTRNLSVGENAEIQKNLLVGHDLAVQNSLSAIIANFRALVADRAEFPELSAVRATIRELNGRKP